MRPTIYIAAIGAIAVIVALVLNFRETGDESAETPVPAVEQPEQTPPAGDAASATDSVAETPSASTSEAPSSSETKTDENAPPETAKVSEKPVAPSYDIVRVNPKGDAVMAGRAAPGATVEIIEGDKAIGSVTADRRGEWVFVPDQPLAPGNKELSLSSTTSDGRKVESETVVVMSIPDASANADGQEDKGVVVVGNPEKTEDTAGGPRDEPVRQQASAAAEPAGTDEGVKTGNPVVVELPKEGNRQARILQGPKEGVRSGGLSLDAIDYDEKGNLNIQGQAPEGARVQLYLDNQFVGTGESAGGGRWTVTPGQEVPPGTYSLRVDQVQADGKVLARLEIPFSRAAPIADLPEGSFVIVQPGNSLWRIARRTYGTGFNFVQIYKANSDQIRDPDLIFPGQIFTLPAAN